MQLGGLTSNFRSVADQARTIRIPVHSQTINKIVRTQRLILSEFGREATPGS